ncbi:MAG: extracellular solute-binding protein [Firmicutes bacterium]|nr:extracellular solute-binding protein [Bacillota bacterium]MBR0481884.1 extracellular solute-binding protein [Bacillota bacterium]
MKKLPKCIILMLLLALLASSLGACHGSTGLEAFEVPEEFDSSREYEITFWAKNDNNNRQVEVYESAIADFEKLYPNIHVTMKKYTDYVSIYNDVITNIPTNTTPNVCISYPDHIATYLTGKNIVIPLDGIMDDEDYGLGGRKLLYDGPDKGEIVGKFLDECKLDGKVYALPFIRSSEALYINSGLVEKMGFTIPDVPTWDWVWEVSEAAMEKNEDGTFKVNGQNVMIPFIYKSTDNMMITIAKQLGSGYSDDEGNILLFNDTTKQVLYEIAKHVETRAFSTFKIASYPGNSLNRGQAVFGIDSTAGSTWMGTDAHNQDVAASELVDYGMVVRPVPQYDPGDPVMISQGPSICVFNKKDPQEVMAAWIFAQYLLTNGVQMGYATTEGYIPVTTKTLESDEYTDYLSRAGEDNDLYYDVKIAATKLVIDNIDNTFITPVFNGSASLREAAGQLIEEVTKSVRRKQTVDDEYMETLFSNINSLYRLDQHAGNAAGKAELGELPKESKILLGSIGAAWIGIAIYLVLKYNKRVSKKALKG